MRDLLELGTGKTDILLRQTANVNFYHDFSFTCALLFITSTPKLVASR